MTALAYVTAAYGASSGTTAPVSSAFALTTGQHVLVWVSSTSPGGSATAASSMSVADTAGNTYTALSLHSYTSPDGTGHVSGRWFYSFSASGNAANKVTATVGGASAGASNGVYAIVLSGTATGVTETIATGIDTLKLGSTLSNGAGSMLLAGHVVGTGDSGSYSIVPEGSPSAPFTFVVNSSFNSAQANAAYLARASGDYQLGRIVANVIPFAYTQNYSARMLSVLQVEAGGAVPSLNSGVSKLSGYALLGARPDAASLSRLSGYAVLDTSTPSTARPQVFVCT